MNLLCKELLDLIAFEPMEEDTTVKNQKGVLTLALVV